MKYFILDRNNNIHGTHRTVEESFLPQPQGSWFETVLKNCPSSISFVQKEEREKKYHFPTTHKA